ncbi:hypothetical protein GCM10027456_54710 [Kineosporia babensis]
MQATRRSRRRKTLTRTALGVVLLVALTVAANVGLTRYVKNSVVEALRCVSGDDTITPTVTLGERPLLVDLAGQEVSQIRISDLSASSMQTVAGSDGPELNGAALSITLRGLGVGLGERPTVKSAEASVSLPWDSLDSALAAEAPSDDLVGATLSEEDGLLALTLPDGVAGQSVKVLVRLEPEGTQLSATPESIVIGGRKVGVGLISLLGGGLLRDENGQSQLQPRTIDPHLPEGTSLEEIRVQSEGLNLKLAIDPERMPDHSAAGRDCLA